MAVKGCGDEKGKACVGMCWTSVIQSQFLLTIFAHSPHVQTCPMKQGFLSTLRRRGDLWRTPLGIERSRIGNALSLLPYVPSEFLLL